MNKLLTREEWLTYLDTTWKKCLADAWQKEWNDMNREDIIRMAREADFEWDGKYLTFEGVICDEDLERFAALVRADEREACARLCDAFESDTDPDAGSVLAAAIRARGQE
jgi:hypothetical protein